MTDAPPPIRQGTEPSTMPYFSIITVVRNDPKGLSRTLDSIEAQSFDDFEWIIIDGASTDRTVELVDTLLNSGRASGVSEPDQGIYDAMNKGLIKARGTYVLFLNAGDILFSEHALKNAQNSIVKTQVDVAFFGSVMTTGRRSFVRAAREPSYLWHGQPGLHQATFFNREMHRKILFDPTFRVCGDYDVLARFSISSATMKSFPAFVSVNAFDTNSTSGKMKIRLIREALSIQKRVLRLPMWKIFLSFNRRVMNSVVLKMVTIYDDRISG